VGNRRGPREPFQAGERSHEAAGAGSLWVIVEEKAEGLSVGIDAE